MAIPKNRTKRDQIKPLGVAERLGTAPPSGYRYGTSPKKLHWCEQCDRFYNHPCDLHP